MPIMLTRKDGPPTPFRSAEYIPFYYFIPKSILSRCGAELNAIPRNPQELFHNRAACEFVESDLFRLLIIDATAFMVWPYMGFGEYMEIYSGYDPAWRFAHCPDYWIQELTDEGILAPAGELFKGCHSELGYVPEWQIDIYLRYIVPNVMKKHRMDEIIQVAREYPCFEDFDFRKSNQKTDFIRQWYHTRTRHPMISLEEFQEAYADAHGGQEYEDPDPSQNVEVTAVAQALADQFKATLSEKDMQILELRMSGDTLEEIAEKPGYADNPGKTTAPEYLDEDLYAALRYAENDDKADRKMFVGGINCSTQNAYAEKIAVQRRFGLRGKVVGYHGIQSFREGEVTPEQAFAIGKETARRMWGDRYQVLVTVHLNTDNVHCHFVVNPASFRDGAKFKNKIGDHKELHKISDEICREHELSVLENSEFYSKGKKKEYWVHKAGKKTHRNYLREDAECGLSFATSPREFEKQLYALGYTLDPVRFSVKAKHWERAARLSSIGFSKERVNGQLRQNTENRYRLFTLEYRPPYKPKKFPLEDELRKLGSPLNTAMTLQPFWWMRCFILS